MPERFRNLLFSFGLFGFALLANSAFSQDFADQHWYFGNNNIAVEFTRPLNVPELITDHKLPPFNVRGNATANKPETGDLLFYTDGLNVYDATYGTMDGISLVDKLDADINKNQSVAIASAPGNNDLYYIFTNTPSGAIHMSQVDMTSNGNAIALQPPLGRVLLPMNELIASSTANASDAMLVVPNATNTGYWLITLDQGTSDYKVLGIDSATPGTWIENTYSLGANMDASHIAFNADSLQIAVAPKSSSVNIQILNIDLTTGVLTFNRELLNTGNADFATEAVFDVEWSADGSKLYYARYGDQAGSIGNVMQVDMGAPPSASPVSVLPMPVFGSYGLQLGPDGNLYHLYQENNAGDPFLIGRLLDADSIASLTTYEPALENNQDFNSFQFPAFLPPRDPQLSVDFSFAGTCANAPTAFFPQITPAPTAVLWDFGDGNMSTDLAPFNTYTAGSTYSVTLTAILNGQPLQINKPVTITDFQVQLTLPQDTVACQCELPKYGPTCDQFEVTVQVQNDPGTLTYTWSTGESGMTLHPDSAGYYYVVATDGICSTYAGVYVQEYDTTIPGIAPDQRSNVWYFGENAGIDFNTTPAVALTDGAMDAMEGCTAVSDRNGQVIFYTDGDVLFDRTHTQIDSGLGGTPNATGPAAQSVIAVGVPNDETLFYIFTTQSTDPSSPNYEFNYSLFDLKENNGFGGVIEKNVTLFTKSTERVAATPNWAVIHEYGNNNFRAYPITAAGIGSPVVSSIGEDYSALTADNGKGYMKFSAGATKLAVAVVENDGVNPSNNYLDLFDFDNTTGTFTDFGRADLDADGASGTVYGVEFSPGGNKVYATVKSGAGSQIMEYRANYVDSMHVYSPIMTDGGELGAIQLGPDGQMYVTSEGVSNLGLINVQEDTLQTSTYTASGFNLAGRNGHLGLPNFVQQTGTAGFSPGISVSTPVCIGDPVFLAANVTSSIDSAEWQITDPTGAIIFTSDQLADTVTLNTPGDHIVALLLHNRCLDPINSFSEIVTVNPPPQNSDLPLSTFLCGTTTTLPVYNSPPANITDLDFLWSTGESTASIDVTLPGTYSVTITDRTSGCTNSADVFVGPPIPVDLGPDQTICENDVLTLDSQVNADTYVWSVNGMPQPGTRFFDFGALALSGGNYTVQVDATIDLGGSIGPCTVSDQAIITINPSPVFTAVEGMQANCGATDGAISVDIPGNGSFDYAVASESGTIAAPVVGFIINNIPPGVNALTLTNTVTGCSQIANVAVTSPTTFSIDAAVPNDETCAGSDGSIDYTVGGIVGSFVATATDVTNAANTFTGTGNGAGNYSVTGIPAGDYTLQIQEDAAPNCIEIWIGNPPTAPPVAQTLTIGTPPDSDLQVSQNPVLSCGLSADLSASVTSLDVTPEWSLDGINFNPIGTAFTTLGSSTVTVRAAATATPTCEATQDIEVVVTPTPTVSITRDESDICNGLVTLTATGDGGYATAQLGYRWSNGASTASIVVSQSGNYTVNTYHTINQSCYVEATENVTLPTPFTVVLSSTLACDDGQPFTLTATPNGQTNNNLDWSWFLNGAELGLTTSSIVGLDEGLYEVVAEDQSGCTANATLQINRIPLTPTNLSSAPVFCPDDGSITLDAGSNFVSYLWSDGSTNQTLEVVSGGLYSIEATNNFGCVTNDQSEVIEDCIPKVSGPNAFRPGGLNNTYSLFTQYVDTFEIFIFDQWGEMVYHSDDKAFAWDGVYNNELLPAGQYSWVVRYTSSFRDRGTIEEYGGVVLLR